ncbi:MAG: lysylphosphatidylglycerol synthase transmembrane domain-containing protein [Planctomycetaceae bacterium]
MTTPQKPFYKSRWFNLTLGLTVTIACLWWAFEQMLKGENGRKTPAEVIEEIGAAFRRADYRTLPAMWLCLAGFYWLKVLRWKFLLEPMGKFRPLKDLLPSTLIGFAFNNVLPAHLGEFVRVFVFSRQTGLPKAAVLTSIVLERIFDIIAILGFLMLGLLCVNAAQIDPTIVTSAKVFGALVCIALTGAAVYLIWTEPMVVFVEGCMDRIPLLPTGLKEKVTMILETGATGLGSLRSGRLLGGILITSVLQWMLNGLTIHLALRAFGIQVSPLVSAIVLGVTAFGVTIPSSPGYFGMIQLCFLLVLNLFVQNREVVFAASIYYHMMQWIPVTVLGMGFFLRAGYHVADVEAAAEVAADVLPD